MNRLLILSSHSPCSFGYIVVYLYPNCGPSGRHTPYTSTKPYPYFLKSFSCNCAPFSLARKYSKRASYRILTSSRRRRMSSISSPSSCSSFKVSIVPDTDLSSSGIIGRYPALLLARLTLDRLADCRCIVGKTGTGGGFTTLPAFLSIDVTLEDEFLRCNELGLDLELMGNN